MAEDVSADPPASPRITPSAPKRPRDPIVIEGKASETPEADERSPLGRGASGFSARPRIAQFNIRDFASGLAGAVIGAAFAVTATWIYDPRSVSLDEVTVRQAELEKTISAEAAAAKLTDARLATLESAAASHGQSDALVSRVSRLEAALAAPDPHLAAEDALGKRLAKLEDTTISTRALAAAQAEARAAREAADQAMTGSAAGKSVADADALSNRIAKLEAIQAAPKAETRIPLAQSAPEDDGAAMAIAAIALDERLRAGEPYATEWQTLSRLGANAAQLAPLKPFSDAGAPRASALGAALAKAEPAIADALHPRNAGSGALDRLLDHVSSLVKVHPVSEAGAVDEDDMLSAIKAALARANIAAALTAYERMPAPARNAAADWAELARARVNADAASHALRDGALARLNSAKN